MMALSSGLYVACLLFAGASIFRPPTCQGPVDLSKVQQSRAKARALVSRVSHPSTGEAEAVGAPSLMSALSTE